jgi:hypothetical protein
MGEELGKGYPFPKLIILLKCIQQIIYGQTLFRRTYEGATMNFRDLLLQQPTGILFGVYSFLPTVG